MHKNPGRFYSDVLSTLPFSIQGYSDIDEYLSTFFTKLADYEGFKKSDGFKFLSYSYVKLEDLQNWRVGPLKDVFMSVAGPNIKMDVSHELSFYFFLHQWDFLHWKIHKAPTSTFEKVHKTPTSTSELLTNFFVQDVSLIVENQKGVTFDVKDKLIRIGIPSNIFTSKPTEIRKQLQSAEGITSWPVSLKTEEKNDGLFELSPEILRKDSFRRYSETHLNKWMDKNKCVKAANQLTKIISEEVDFGKVAINIKRNLVKPLVNSLFAISWWNHVQNSTTEYILSAASHDEKNNRNKNLGALIVGRKRNKGALLDNDRALFRIAADRVTSALAVTMVRDIDRERTHHARRAAVAQVMARNMSHNIGSHVLVNLATPKQVAKLKSTPREANESASPDTRKALLVDVSALEDQSELSQWKSPDAWKNYQIAAFNSYLKSRMDYLADVATSTPSLQNNAFVARQVLGVFVRNKPLVNHISGIDKFEYSIKAFDRIDDKKRPQLNLNATTKHDIIASFPNDVLGHHAFYNILENLVRNAAKHGGLNDTTVCFEIEIGVCEHDDTLLEVLVYDKISKDEHVIKGKVDANKKDLEDYAHTLGKTIDDVSEEDYQNYQMSKHPNVKELRGCATCLKKGIRDVSVVEYQVYKINKHLNEGVIGSDSKLRRSAWGLIEMEVSAAYLRKISPDEVDEKEFEIRLGSNTCQGITRKEDYKPPVNILKAVVVGEKYLGYRFHLLKPANYLVVGKYENSSPKLMNFGIKVITKEELKASRETYPHEFLLDEDMGDHQTRLPMRHICMDENLKRTIKEHLEDTTIDPLPKIDKEIWTLWIKKMFDNKVKKLSLYSGLGSENDRADQVEGTATDGKELEAMFDDHVKRYSEWEEKKGAYYEPLSSQGRGLLPAKAFSQNENEADSVDLRRVAESILFRVGVIDERIQSALSLDYKGILFRKLYPLANIFVPSPREADLNKSDFGGGRPGSVKKQIESWLDIHLECLDALVIHIGVLEKMLPGSTEDDGKNIILKYLKDNIIKEHDSLNLILTSGRGQPHNLPPEVRFINFSSLMECLVLNRSKFVLTNLIFSARRLKR